MPRAELALAEIQEHRHAFEGLVRGDDVEQAIRVQIGERDRHGKHPDAEALRRAESAKTVAQQHRDIVLLRVRGDDVRNLVAAHIPNRQTSGEGPIANREALLRGQPAGGRAE